jgi:hypothetical protein
MKENNTRDSSVVPLRSKTGVDYQGLFHGTNCLTPYVIRYGELKRAGGRPDHYELSFGPGLGNGTLWGVTVRDQNGKRLANDPSRCFGSLEDAETYIRNLCTFWPHTVK